MATIQGVYVALFGRPADPTGLNYFNSVSNNGADLTQVGDLASTAEYKARFEGKTNGEIITSIYQSLFGRNPEQAGLDFFTKALADGTFTINNIAIAILDGAQGDDKTLVDKKIAAADLFTAAIDTPDEIASYQGTDAASNGIAFLTAVTSASSTVDAAAAQAAVTALPAPSTSNPGATITLSAGNDVVNTTQTDASLKTTAGDDDIRAIIADSLDVADVIDGGAGSDTLNISALAMDGTSVAAVITNVERINTADADGLDFTNITGVSSLWASDSNTTAHSEVDASKTTIGAEKMTGAETILVEFAGTDVKSAMVAVNNTNAAGDATFDFGADAATITSVDVMASSTNKGIATLDGDLNALTTVTASGTGKATIVSAEATIKTADFSGNSGGITFDASAATALTSAKGGAGADVLTVDNSATTASKYTVDLGAGADTLNLVLTDDGTASAITVTGGAGGDSFKFTAGGNLFAAGDNAALLADLVTITDFDKANDVFDVSGFGSAVTAQNVIDNAISAGGETELFKILEDAVAAGGANSSFLFAVGSDTYYYDDTSGSGTLAAGDTLVQLTGIAVTDLDGTNFIAA